jgi:hypothetical protein
MVWAVVINASGPGGKVLGIVGHTNGFLTRH